jgi:hypothetical protein
MDPLLKRFIQEFSLRGESSLGACRAMGDCSEEVGERVQIFTILRRIVGLCNEKLGIFAPLSLFRSRFIHSPTGS